MSNDLEYVSIGLSSPEMILSWSYGEVTKPETINYRTSKPEKEGLFCERIFGPVKDFYCSSGCGMYKKQPKFEGVVCERCGVEVAPARVRRERMGHIELAAPVAHYWFFKTNPYYIPLLLDVPNKKVESVIQCRMYIVTDPGETPLEKKQILTSSEYDRYVKEYRGQFEAGVGAKAIQTLLAEINLEELSKTLLESISTEKTAKRVKMIKRLKVVDAFRRSGNRPEWMIMTILPIIPPDLRPMVPLDGGRFATSDLNDLYRRIINRNNRLKKLIEKGAPELIIENEISMLQDAVDSLIANVKKPRNRQVLGPGNRPLKCLSSTLKGKQGLFRQNLLGKRVDYSGRSVIAVEPELKIHQCGLPKKMALELFKPFVMERMKALGLVQNTNQAKRKIEQKKDEVWDVLEEVVKNHPVLLNRAPTLHKLSIRAFEVILVEGNAIKLHPLVCSGFNADFDGDQMAVHVPLSLEAQTEARILMLASENLLHPQNGSSAVTHSQDMVLGCYYLSVEEDGAKGEGKVFKNEEEAINAYELGLVSLHSKIVLYIKNNPKFQEGKYLVTTVGKIEFNRSLPKKYPYINDSKIEETLSNGVFTNIKEAMEFIPHKPNKEIGKGFLKEMIDYGFDSVGKQETAVMIDGVKDVGFKYATKGGLTFALSDIHTPVEKEQFIKSAEEKVHEIERLCGYGRISEEQRYEEVVSVWDKTTSDISKKAMEHLNNDKKNPIRMMIDSGARGNEAQFKQVAGARGLMADPSGRTIERPIKSNFKEGLTVFEYFISSHGARKGMSDTSLKTADSGYLTRRMVDVAQDVVVTEEDCHTEEYFVVKEIPEWEELKERIAGRTVAEDVFDKEGNLIAHAGTLLTEKQAEAIQDVREEVKMRSLLTCETKHGVCRKCYGLDLATREEVEVGEAVGVIAAQSIGEPGTQLTMRTFHTGGIAGDDITQGLPRIVEILEARNIDIRKGKAILAEVEGTVQIIEKGQEKEIHIIKEDGEREVYEIPQHYGVIVMDGQEVKVGQALTQGSINPHELLRLKGLEKVQRYLIEEVQLVYLNQGVKINDKHIEIIVRQMCRKVVIKDPGDSKQVYGKVVDKYKLKALNKKLRESGKLEVTYSNQLMGITGASLNTDSFLSAASFQETERALADAAVSGKRDTIKGLKEAVITGRKIPAGTGFHKYIKQKKIEIDE